MKKQKKYQEISPGESWFKKTIVNITLYFLGMGIQAAYRLEPEVKREMDNLPDPYTFILGAHGGPSMVVQKRAGKVRYLRTVREHFKPDLTLRFKNLEYLYLAMTGRISTPDAAYHNRQYVEGSLNHMMAMIRVLNITQTLLFPNIIVRFYIKKVPRLTLRKMVNRVLAYIDINLFAAFR